MNREGLPALKDELLLWAALPVLLLPEFASDCLTYLSSSFVPGKIRGEHLRAEDSPVPFFPDLPEGETWQQLPYQI